jgi:hypothetical protein
VLSPEQRKADDDRDLETASNLLAELLVKMGKQLGYDFDRHMSRKPYFPEGLRNIDQEQHAVREGLLNLLSGQGAKLPVAVFTQDFQPIRIQPPLEPEFSRQDGQPRE